MPVQNRRKAKTEKELQKWDALWTPSKDARELLWIVSYIVSEKNPQSTETVSRMAKSGERSNRWPVDICACALLVPRLGITWVNTGEMPGRMTTMAGDRVYVPIGGIVVDSMQSRGGPYLKKMECSRTMHPCLPGKE